MPAIATPTFRAKLYSTTNTTSYATDATYTPAAGSLLIAFVVVSATSPVAPPTVAGHGVTWTALTLTTHTLSTTHRLDVYVAKAGASPTNGAFTVSGYGASQTGAAIIEFEVVGADTSGTAAQAIVQNPTNTGTATSGSVTLAAAGNSNNRPMSFFVHLANELTTPRVNWTESANADGSYNTPTTGAEAQFRTDAFETTASASWTTSSLWRGVALELKSAPDQSLTTGTRASTVTINAPTLAYAVTAPTRASTVTINAPTVTGPVLVAGTYNRALTVTSSSAKLPSTQSNFPLLVSFTDVTLKDVAHSGHVNSALGYDLVFWSDSGFTTRLKWELEFYDPATGQVIAWVKIPSLALGTVFYLTYGDSTASAHMGGTVLDVWGSNANSVYHLAADVTIEVNSSDSGTFASGVDFQNGARISSVTGQIGSGAGCNGVSDFGGINLVGKTIPLATFSLSAWVKFTSLSVKGIAWSIGNELGGYGFGIGDGAGGVGSKLCGILDSTWVDSGHTIAGTTAYYLIAMERTGGTIRFYVAGVQTANTSAIAPGNNTAANIGAQFTGAFAHQFPFAGNIDEARLEDVARGADWYITRASAESDPTFLAIGGESSGGSIALTSGTIASSTTIYAPSLAYAVTTGTVAAGTTLYAPSLAYAITLPTIASTTTLAAPTLAYAMTAGTVAATTTLFAPTITPGAVTLTLTNVAATTTLYAPTLAYAVTTGTVGSTVVLFAPTLAYAVTTATIAATTTLFAPSLSYVISLATIGSTVVLFAPTIDVSTLLLAPTIAATTVIFAPTITPGDVTLIGAFLSSGALLFAPSLSYVVDLATIGSTVVLFAPTVTPGAVTLTLAAIVSTTSVFAPTLATTYELLLASIATTVVVFAPSINVGPPTIAATTQVFAPTLSYVVLAPSISATTTVFAPVVSPGAVAVVTAFISSGSLVYAPSLAYAVVTAVIGSTTVVFAPTLTTTYELLLPTVGSTVVVFAPTVVAGAAELLLSTIATTTVVFAPAIANAGALAAPSIASTIIFAPTVTPGAVELLLTRIESTVVLFTPALTFQVDASSIASGTIVFAPALAYAVSLPFVADTTVIFAPSLETITALALPRIESTLLVFAPSLQAEGAVITAFIPSGGIVYAPSLEYGQEVAAPSIDSTVIIYAPFITGGERNREVISFQLSIYRRVSFASSVERRVSASLGIERRLPVE